MKKKVIKKNKFIILPAAEWIVKTKGHDYFINLTTTNVDSLKLFELMTDYGIYIHNKTKEKYIYLFLNDNKDETNQTS